MTTHTYRRVEVPVPGGALTVGVWDPVSAEAGRPPTVLAVHGVTSSHLAWPFVVGELPGIRVIAPDLRGRGGSNGVVGPTGLRRHAGDLAAVLDAFGEECVPVLGHSMGGFVAVVFADLYPQRVSRLMLIDGGLPLDVPPGLSPEELVGQILGPTAQRLSQRWASVEEYIDGFWRQHPAFVDDWSAELEAYIAYDLVADGERLRPATSAPAMIEDTVDLNTGPDLRSALERLRHPAVFITVPRGLQNEEPGLYAPEYLRTVLAAHPWARHVRLDGLNHYTVVMSARGAAELGTVLRTELAEASPVRS